MYKVMTIIKIWKYSVFSEKLVNSCIKPYLWIWKEAFKRVYTSSCVHALLRPIFEEYKGRGATVASDVTGHRGPKIQQK